MGKWLISAALLAILAIAVWASYGLWIRVVASVPAWVWLLLAFGGGLSIVRGTDGAGLLQQPDGFRRTARRDRARQGIAPLTPIRDTGPPS